MNRTKTTQFDKADSPELTALEKLGEGLEDYVRQAAAEGLSQHETERGILDRVLQMGAEATKLFLQLQGDGDLGEEITTEQGTTLYRSETPVNRDLQTIFVKFSFPEFVYSRGRKKAIELRPLSARMNLPAGVTSYLFEEFSQLFCLEEAFGTARQNFQTVFGLDLKQASFEVPSWLGEGARLGRTGSA